MKHEVIIVVYISKYCQACTNGIKLKKQLNQDTSLQKKKKDIFFFTLIYLIFNHFRFGV